jgi:hypothetical protein
MANIVFYFKVGNEFRYIRDDDDENKFYKTNKFKYGYITFEGLRMDPNYRSLCEYKRRFNECNEQLRSISKTIIFSDNGESGKHISNHWCVYNVFFKACNYIITKRLNLDMPKICDYDEFMTIESTDNGGLQYFNEAYKNVVTECFGYDYPAFYPSLLGAEWSELKIPTNKGTAMKFESLNFGKLKFGIYNVRILSSNPDAQKVFKFNKRSWYNYYCINFAYEYKDQLGFTFELLHEGGYNAYVYSNFMFAKSMFSNWYTPLMKVKAKYPDNFLVKHLLSTLHGVLTGFKVMDKNDIPDLENADITPKKDREYSEYKFVRTIITNDKNGVPNKVDKVVDVHDPYRYPFARMKSFLTSYGRCHVGKFIMSQNLLPHVIRIHTDGIVFNKECSFTCIPLALGCVFTHDLPVPLKEKKTTGLLCWASMNFNDIYEYVDDTPCTEQSSCDTDTTD